MNYEIDEDLTKEEEDRLKKTYRQICRDSTRAQVVQTMADHRGIGSEIYEACHAELLVRDRADDKRYVLSENKRVWKAATPKQRRVMAKRRKLNPGVRYITF